MLEQISQLVKEYGQDAVVNNPEIPNEENNAVMAEATKTITSGMQNMMAGGGLQDIISMFTQGGGAGNNSGAGGIGGLIKNPVVTMMVGHLISKLTGKFNMSTAQASQVSNNLIPNVLNDLVNKTGSNEPENDAFDLNDLIGSLTGGAVANQGNSSGFNFQDLISQFTGGGQPGSGNGTGNGFNLEDIIGQVTRGAQEKRVQEKNEGGGITDLIKGFFN